LALSIELRGAQRFFEDRQNVHARDRLRRLDRHRSRRGRIDRIIQSQNIAEDRLRDLVHVGVGKIQRHVVRLRRRAGGPMRQAEGLAAGINRAVVVRCRRRRGGTVRGGGSGEKKRAKRA
jgi:hypothetical protein